MCRMDNLFWSIRVSNESSSVTKGFHFFELFWTPDFLCVQNAPFKATSSIFNPSWLHLVFFMQLLIFWAKWPWNWKALQMKSQMVESWHAIYHHFTRITNLLQIGASLNKKPCGSDRETIPMSWLVLKHLESRVLNPHKIQNSPESHQRWHGVTSWHIYVVVKTLPIWAKLYYEPLTNRSFSQQEALWFW